MRLSWYAYRHLWGYLEGVEAKEDEDEELWWGKGCSARVIVLYAVDYSLQSNSVTLQMQTVSNPILLLAHENNFFSSLIKKEEEPKIV